MDTRKASVYLDLASTGQIVDLQKLVGSDGCIDSCDIAGKSALWLAIERGNSVAVEILLKAGALVNKTYQSRQTPLMLAVDRGRTEYIQVMLEAGATVDNVDSFGESALMIACERGNIEILQKLVTAGANLHLRDIRGKTGLMIAVENNSCECLKYLIAAGAKIDIKDFQGNSPLMTAVYQNCATCIQTLVQAGASVNELQRYGKTILMIAVERGSNVLQLLIENGASLDATDNRLKTATMYAASMGHVSSLDQLVQAGANLNLIDEQGQTALMMAAEAGHASCIECLMKGGARQEIQDAIGRTALMLAASQRHHECLQVLLSSADSCKNLQCRNGKTALIYAVEAISNTLLSCLSMSEVTQKLVGEVGSRDFMKTLDPSIKCVQILLKAGASPAICDKSDMSPLMYAARGDKSANCFQDLLDAGADIHMLDRSGLTALGHAACCQNVEFIKRLIEAGASVNTCTPAGETPLLSLAKKPDSSNACDGIAYLLDHNADVNVQDPKGMTPLMWAAKFPTGKNAMSLLINHGADINMMDGFGFSALHHTLGQHNELLINARFLLDSGANPNLRTAEGKTTVSLTVRDRNHTFLDLLLEYNADLCMDWADFCHLVQSGDKKMLQYMVLHGLFPSSPVSRQGKLDNWTSVLTTMLNSRSLAMAKFLFAVGYLNNSDVICRRFNLTQLSIFKIPGQVSCLRRIAQPQTSVTTFLNSAFSQPWPLVKLCFVAVSTNMGSSPGREDRVRRSGLPDRLQRMILFQEPISKLCVSHWDSIPLCFNPDDYEKLPKPRPLLFYWPFGRDITRCDCNECSQAGFKFV